MNPQRETSTFQWDTVFAIPVERVNQAIVEQGSSPASFEHADAHQNRVGGRFATWQIAPNGDGKNINMRVPIQGVAGSIAGLGFALDSAQLIVEVNLEYLPAELQDSAQGVTGMHLKVRARSDSPDLPVVSLVSCQFSQPPTGEAVTDMGAEAVQDIIPALVVAWLGDNLASFAHVFCTVELNKYIDHAQGWTWTKPTDLGYAYVDGEDDRSSLLGVLCMTGGRKRTVQQSDVLDPGAIPVGSVAGFLVAQQRLLEELILPTIPLHWPQASAKDFEVVPDGDTTTGRYQWVLRLKAGRSFGIGTAQIVNGSGNSALTTPVMKTFSIATDGVSLTMTAYTETDVGEGVTAWNKSVHQYEVVLGTNGNGQQTINYRTMGTPDTTHGTYEGEGAKILKWMEIAVGVIATVALGLVTDGAGFVVGALIIGVLTGLAAESPDIVEVVNSDSAPSTDLLSFNATNPIKWANSKVFQLTDVLLNGPLQLGGNPDFNEQQTPAAPQIQEGLKPESSRP